MGCEFGSALAMGENPHGFASSAPLVPGQVITNKPSFCTFPFNIVSI